MIEVSCSFCQKQIRRYLNKKRPNALLYCSRFCKSEHQKTINVGKANPNYRGRDLKRVCECGQEKDHRAQLCSQCAKKSFSISDDLFKQIKNAQTTLVKENLQEANSLLELANKTKLSRHVVTCLVKQHDLSVEHFRPGRARVLSFLKLFSASTKKRYAILKSAIIKHNLLDYCCSKCYGKGVWMEEVLTLELDHINGDSCDNRLENLRFLCPNCHSQTPTYKGKNSRGKKKTRK